MVQVIKGTPKRETIYYDRPREKGGWERFNETLHKTADELAPVAERYREEAASAKKSKQAEADYQRDALLYSELTNGGTLPKNPVAQKEAWKGAIGTAERTRILDRLNEDVFSEGGRQNRGEQLAHGEPEGEAEEDLVNARSGVKKKTETQPGNEVVTPEGTTVDVSEKKPYSQKKINNFINAGFTQEAAAMQRHNDNLLREEESFRESQRRREESSEKLNMQSFKNNEKYIEKVLGGYEAYKRDEAVLDQMEGIVNKGNLPSPTLVKVLNTVGIPLGFLESADSEQFEKDSQELVKNIQGTFGSRILASEVASFMRSIPTLLNSEEGKRRLIRQWQIMNEGKKVYYDAYKEVRSSNPERIPNDLHEQVLMKAEGRLDDISRKFKLMAEIPSDYRKTQGKVLVHNPTTGEVGEIDENSLTEALEEGYDYLE